MDEVTLHVDGPTPPKVTYAITQFERALASRGTRVERTTDAPDIVAGTPKRSDDIDQFVSSDAIELPDADEALAIACVDGTAYAIGRDDQGLMYALLEVAEQVELEGRPLEDLRETSVKPGVDFRGIYTFLHNEDCDAEWFHDEDHWTAYFDLLARSRYNSFHLVVGHQTNYLVPPFPFYVDVDEHPEVTVPDLSEEDRRRNLESLRRIAEIAHDRGLDFVLGIWEVIAWLPESRGGGHVQESPVDGLDRTNLESYTYRGLRTLLEECPGIDGIQVRTNAESGVPMEDQTEFFSEAVFRALEDTDREIYLDLRGWGAHEETIERASAADFPMRLSMKYWAEHLGGPYQAPDQLPSYSFADFLKYPREYPVAYQVWTLGSHRIFVWGDPEYARTFGESLNLGDATGFEICPQLAQKGYGNQPGSWRLLTDEFEHYEWEFERYWLFHLLFGRLTYDPQADADVWSRHLRARFGEHAEDVLDAYAVASRVLTCLIRFNMSDPNMYIFPEADTGGVLDHYLDVQPSDPALIKSFREAAAEQVAGEYTARLDPSEISAYFRDIGESCLDYVATLKDAAAENAELAATLVDVEALGELSLYHAQKSLAAEQLALFYETNDFTALDAAVEYLEAVTPHWKRLVEATDDAYNDHIVTGPVDNVTWEEKLQLVAEDVDRLQQQRKIHRRYGGFEIAFDFGGSHELGVGERYNYLNRTFEGEQQWLRDFYRERGFVGVDATCEFDWGAKYGWSDTGGLSATRAPLVRLGDKNLDTLHRDTNDPTGWESLEPYGNQLYADHVSGGGPASFHVTIEPGDYEVIVILADRNQNPDDHGPLTVSVNGEELASGQIVPAGDVVDLRTTVELDRDELEVAFDAEDGSDWIVTGIVVRPAAPVVAHSPPQATDSEKGVDIAASVYHDESIEDFTLFLKGQDGVVRTVTMEKDDAHIYRASVPNQLLRTAVPVRYWFEATDSNGRRTRLPARTEDRTVFELLPAPAGVSPSIEHTPIGRARPGESIRIIAKIESVLPVQHVRLHYRYANQYYEYETVEMERIRDTDTDGINDIYYAEIPGEYVDSDWDLIYYIDSVDEAGNGNFSPEPDSLANPVREIPYYVIEVER